MYLTPTEVQREVSNYMTAQALRSGETPAEMLARPNGGVFRALAQMRVTRQKYRHLTEWTPTHKKSDDVESRTGSISDSVQRTIKTNAVVEGAGVHGMREWQALKGEKGQGLLLLGGAGEGKSLHAAMLLVGNALEVEREGVHVAESQLCVNIGLRREREREAAMSPLQSAPLVVVDHMGVRKHQSGWEAGVVEFLRGRWEAGRKCVLTFRGDVGAFRRVYGADGWATVERFCTVMTVRRGR